MNHLHRTPKTPAEQFALHLEVNYGLQLDPTRNAALVADIENFRVAAYDSALSALRDLAPEKGLIRVVKHYPCGCSAGPGPLNLPDYCPDHGSPDDTAGVVVDHVETGAGTATPPGITLVPPGEEMLVPEPASEDPEARRQKGRLAAVVVDEHEGES